MNENMEPCAACGALWPAPVSTGPSPFDISAEIPEVAPCDCTWHDREAAANKLLRPTIAEIFGK